MKNLKSAGWGAALAALVGPALAAEEMVFVTYYPAPVAFYNVFSTTQVTTLATTVLNAMVTIATTTLDTNYRLHVAGDIQMHAMRFAPKLPLPASDCTAAFKGKVYYNDTVNRLYYCMDPDGTGPSGVEWKKVMTQEDLVLNTGSDFIYTYRSIAATPPIAANLRDSVRNYVETYYPTFYNDAVKGPVIQGKINTDFYNAVDAKITALNGCLTDNCRVNERANLANEMASKFKDVMVQIFE